MKNIILVFLIIGATLIFFSCQGENALAPDLNQNDQSPRSLAKSKSSPNLIGTVETKFDFYSLDPLIVWKGTVDFGEGPYGIYFISYPEPEDPEPKGNRQASHFYENFIIHELDDESKVYLKGWNSGVVTSANKVPNPVKFRANGKITEAYDTFAEWQGCNVHIKGLVYWITDELPEKAVGTLRIN